MDYTVEVLKKCKEYGFKVSFSSTVSEKACSRQGREPREADLFLSFPLL